MKRIVEEYGFDIGDRVQRVPKKKKNRTSPYPILTIVNFYHSDPLDIVVLEDENKEEQHYSVKCLLGYKKVKE